MGRTSASLLVLALAATVPIEAAGAQAVKIPTLQLDASAHPGVGQFVPADDEVQHLVYELFVSNYDRDLRFAAVDVEDAATGQKLASFDSKALDDPQRLKTPGKNRLLPAWRTAIMTVEVKLPLGASVPDAVRHRIRFESDPNVQLVHDDGSLSSELFAVSEPMPINRARPLVIDAPLRGGPWRCGNGIGFGNSHEAIYASDKIARMHVPQRFGCDFGKVDTQGNTLPSPFPNAITSSMFYGYGADVIAVADGRVAKIQDGIPENVPRADGKVVMPVPLTDRTFPGNMVALEIRKGQYAFYAHLQPGSLRVKEGDRVGKGQLLGKLGTSGNSGGPHLHFQICNGPLINSCDFVPHVYRSYWLFGHARDGKPDPAKRKRVDLKVPTEGSFMTFPSR
jgi:hypothetical protein